VRRRRGGACSAPRRGLRLRIGRASGCNRMKLPLSRLAEFIAAAELPLPDDIAQGYSIDSRTVRPGELFFAVQGERLDGHDYVTQALEAGAVGAVIRAD